MKFGIQRPPCVFRKSIVAVVPEVIVAMLPNHAWPPFGPYANHQTSTRPSPMFSMNRPWPGCAGSYHAPVMPAIGPTVFSTDLSPPPCSDGGTQNGRFFASVAAVAPPQLTPTGVVRRERFMNPVPNSESSAKSTRPLPHPVKLKVSVPIGVLTASAATKLGRKRAPCVRTTATTAVVPWIWPTPPNHACAPFGSNVNHHATRRPSESWSRNSPCPACAGSYHAPV